MKVTKIFDFAAGHRLSGYDGSCFNFHGHNYRLEVTMEGKLDKLGMVVDFKELKSFVDGILAAYFDHKTILKKDDPINKGIVKTFCELAKVSGEDAFYLVNYNPTAENMAKDLFQKISETFYNDSFSLAKIILYETGTSYAEITK